MMPSMGDFGAELGVQGVIVAALVAVFRRFAPGFWKRHSRIAKLGVVALAAGATAGAQAIASGGVDLASSAGRGALAFAIGIGVRETLRREAPAVVRELADTLDTEVTQPNADNPRMPPMR